MWIDRRKYSDLENNQESIILLTNTWRATLQALVGIRFRVPHTAGLNNDIYRYIWYLRLSVYYFISIICHETGNGFSTVCPVHSVAHGVKYIMNDFMTPVYPTTSRFIKMLHTSVYLSQIYAWNSQGLKVFYTFGPSCVIIACMSDELWWRQAQNGGKFYMEVQFDLEGKISHNYSKQWIS